MSLLDSERVRGLLERAGLGGLQPRAQIGVLALAAVVIVFGLWRFWPAAPAPARTCARPHRTRRLCSNVPGQYAVIPALADRSIDALVAPGGRLYEARKIILTIGKPRGLLP